ncbi:hypothetical protein [Desulfuromonas sp. AOP6]|uniref:hypothetical protein n=1 Tax=Desulfuromonas sp. AOP6 TaxID=1566351 RepID=UPI001273F74F|nr:hypothetical protein [Desulfuromonas sp. AOP6]BCA80532.1 hypothetical protein AOP6_2319 [Desulfuromonas sp. AOP6]
MELLEPKEKQDLWHEMQELLVIRKRKRSRHLVGVVGLFFCMGVSLLVLGACYQADREGATYTPFDSAYAGSATDLMRPQQDNDPPTIIHL